MSLAIFISEAASTFKAPDASTAASFAASASNLLRAVRKRKPVISDTRAGEGLVEALGRVEAGTDGRAALGQFRQARQCLLHPVDTVFHLLDIAGEFLPQGERYGVLGVGPGRS